MRPRWITWVLSAAAVVALTGCPFPEAECDGSKTIADRQCRGTELWRCNTAGFYAPIEYCGEAGSACVETTSAPGGAKWRVGREQRDGPCGVYAEQGLLRWRQRGAVFGDRRADDGAVALHRV